MFHKFIEIFFLFFEFSYEYLPTFCCNALHVGMIEADNRKFLPVLRKTFFSLSFSLCFYVNILFDRNFPIFFPGIKGDLCFRFWLIWKTFRHRHTIFDIQMDMKTNRTSIWCMKPLNSWNTHTKEVFVKKREYAKHFVWNHFNNYKLFWLSDNKTLREEETNGISKEGGKFAQTFSYKLPKERRHFGWKASHKQQRNGMFQFFFVE